MKHWLLIIHGGCLALLLWALPLYAQNSQDGHLINQIGISTEGREQFLVLQGSFSLDLIPSIQIQPEDDPTFVTIVIPNGLVNTLELSNDISFLPEDLIKTIKIEETIDKNGSSMSFEVLLRIVARRPILLKPDASKTNERQLAYLIVEKGATSSIENELGNSNIASLTPGMKSDGSNGMDKSMMKAGMLESDKLLLHPVSAAIIFQRPTKLYLSILNASPKKDAAHQLAILLDRQQRQFIENRLDMKMDVTNISSVREKISLEKTKIYFRPNFLSAALALATVIPGDQIVEQMPLERLGRIGVDVEIFVGVNFE